MKINHALIEYLRLENQVRLQLLTHKLTDQEADRVLKNARAVVEFLRDEEKEVTEK